jgi:hypothetical protein
LRDREFEECCWLVKNGVPFDVAFDLDDVDRSAMSIHFSRFEGNKFNIDRLEWVKNE